MVRKLEGLSVAETAIIQKILLPGNVGCQNFNVLTTYDVENLKTVL